MLRPTFCTLSGSRTVAAFSVDDIADMHLVSARTVALRGTARTSDAVLTAVTSLCRLENSCMIHE